MQEQKVAPKPGGKSPIFLLLCLFCYEKGAQVFLLRTIADALLVAQTRSPVRPAKASEIPRAAFEALADAFYAQPDVSVQGWNIPTSR
ncbi:hypothetical protein ROLI_006590 [Roseobacter fucihabitans]|uniref:Uncharacterized protein n=1 Tax=Roseobacter fucihabitans TaxID=1537242 RepID=A0ABZ2BQ12_9RHOB|nr:hypothetical protein [Roseobacter litoralis]